MANLYGQPFEDTAPDTNTGVNASSYQPKDPYAKYQYAADVHTAGNNGFAFTDPTTWGEGVGNATKFTIAAAVSGLNGFVNTGIAVANFLGADVKENDTAAQLASLDSDLGKYYQENKSAIDTVGFVVSSLVPGLGGVKLLNAGQKLLRASETGIVGGNIGKALGLLTPEVKTYRSLAAIDIAKGSQTFSILNGNALKAVAAGYGQATLEAFAFETAVTATTFKSPVLDEQDGWDIAKHIVTVGLVGGAIGGAITHAVTARGIRNAASKLNPAEKLFTTVAVTTGASPAQKISALQSSLETLPPVPLASEIADGTFAPAQALLKDIAPQHIAGAAQDLAAKFGALRESTVAKVTNNIREEFHGLAKGDTDLGNVLADFHQGLTGNESFAKVSGIKEIGRVGKVLEAEIELAKGAKKFAKDLLKNPDADYTAPTKIGYIKLKGEGVGNISFEAPKVLGLADTLATKEEVLAQINKAGFKETKLYDALEETSHTNAEARYIWADRFAVPTEGMTIHANDIPLLEKVLSTPSIKGVSIVDPARGLKYELNNGTDLFTHVKDIKDNVAQALRLDAKKSLTNLTDAEIGKIVNVQESYLAGERANESAQLFARQTEKEMYTDFLRKSNTPESVIKERTNNFDITPTHTKVAYDIEGLTADGHFVDAAARLKTQQKAYLAGIDLQLAAILPEDLSKQLYRPSEDVLRTADRSGAGPGLFTFANADYGTVGSWAEYIGKTTQAIRSHFSTKAAEDLASPITALRSNPESAIAFEQINKKISSTYEDYVLAADGSGLEIRSVAKYKADIAAGKRGLVPPAVQEGAEQFIPFENDAVANAVKTHIKLSDEVTSPLSAVRNAQGLADEKLLGVFRPIRQDPKDFPFFAIVSDETVTGVGHKSMLHANTAEQLDQLIVKAKAVNPNYTIARKGDLKDYFKGQGIYDSDLALHENYIDSSLKRNGVNNPVFIQTDPTVITQKLLDHHLRSRDILSRELVSAKFEKEFNYLNSQGDNFTGTATSTYGGSLQKLENTIKNPYTNIIKTALNISQVGEHPILEGFNRTLDRGVSKIWNTIQETAQGVKSAADIDKLNEVLKRSGVSSAYQDAATVLLANHTAPKGVLSNFVGKANGIIAALVTRTDPFNFLTNVVGAQVLYGTETRSFARMLQNAAPELRAEFNNLLTTAAPLTENVTNSGLAAQAKAGLTPDSIKTPSKLLMNSIKNFFDKEAVGLDGRKLHEYYKSNNWTSSATEQFNTILDQFALKGSESVTELGKRVDKATELMSGLVAKGEVWSGNKLGEEFNRFVAADTMRQMHDILIRAGKSTIEEQGAYINTFVNRTQGNVLASQRPLLFQGPVGQAIGLFQTFQFNTIQQLFRHVGEGQTKDAAMLLGLQGSLFGLNGLPAFHFLNTHIVGTLSGNKDHRDLYSATYGVAGQNIGNLLLYGLPSNLLQANLYTRGDINPRTLTVVPVNPLDIPFVNASTRLFDNLKTVSSKIANGGDVWQSVLQGIEHNGLSRPLAGLAAAAQGLTNGGYSFTTTNKGSISYVNDLVSVTTAIRIAGAKPLDESIANDTVFRFTQYQAADRAKQEKLAQAVRTTTIAGNNPTEDQVVKFAEAYASGGGKQQQFNQFFVKQFKEANVSRANKIIEGLKLPQAQQMQIIMGGSEGIDGRNIPPQ